MSLPANAKLYIDVGRGGHFGVAGEFVNNA